MHGVITGKGTHIHRRTRIYKPLLAVALLVLGVGVPAWASTGSLGALSARGVVTDAGQRCTGANLRPTHSNLAALDAATACLINHFRSAARLRGLRPNRSLQQIAASQSLEMVLGDYFGDNSRSGQTPLQRIIASPYPSHDDSLSTAQNIGWGTRAAATPAEMVAGWMASPPHRQIILTGDFRDIGVGIAPAAPPALAQGQPGATYTVELGVRQP